MNKNYVELQFGYGSKAHAGVVVPNGQNQLILVLCGSRKAGTGKRVIGELKTQSFAKSASACEKCAEKIAKVAA
jgi:hypothetical protein